MTHYDILCPITEVVRNAFTNRIYLLPCVLVVPPKLNDIYPRDCVKSHYIYIEFDKHELPYNSYNIFYCSIAKCPNNSEWNNSRVKLYQSFAMFGINPSINLIMDNISYHQPLGCN